MSEAQGLHLPCKPSGCSLPGGRQACSLHIHPNGWGNAALTAQTCAAPSLVWYVYTPCRPSWGRAWAPSLPRCVCCTSLALFVNLRDMFLHSRKCNKTREGANWVQEPRQRNAPPPSSGKGSRCQGMRHFFLMIARKISGYYFTIVNHVHCAGSHSSCVCAALESTAGWLAWKMAQCCFPMYPCVKHAIQLFGAHGACHELPWYSGAHESKQDGQHLQGHSLLCDWRACLYASMLALVQGSRSSESVTNKGQQLLFQFLPSAWNLVSLRQTSRMLGSIIWAPEWWPQVCDAHQLCFAWPRLLG